MQIEELIKLDEAYLLSTYAKQPLNFVSGKNATLYTNDGRDYIDFGSGIGVCSVGHANEELNKNLKDQLEKITHLSNLYLNVLQAKLAQKIVELSQMDGRVFFGNSGAEANECAIKIARKFGEKDGKQDRYKIITLESSFHGRTIATLRATGQEKFHQHFSPFPDGFVIAKDIKSIYDLIDDKTCAVMIELIQGEGGVSAFDKKEVEELAKFLKQNNVLLIVDEVQTGVFRSGEMFASQVYEIKPDVITMAKGLGGGIPIGAAFTTLKDIFEPGDHGSTFGGNFLSSRAGISVLEILEKEAKNHKIKDRIEKFESHLNQMLQQYSNLFIEKTGLGLMRGLKAKNSDIQAEIIKKAIEERVLVLKSGRNVVRFLPSLMISDEEMELGFERLKKACSRI